ncbi:hypothetical protein N7615_03085 [Klebsiella grimontii]|uniref:hypothetical protein n=1 Tax=Klebsiella grimontii TaxID=2058152 RepID=UPI0024491E25|nr:hypothetical protein [Klebsiella grimontii]MDG9896307.1 hypothetical protein [Klebsiella grimontii]
MKNEIEQIAQQNKMSIEFVTWFFNKKKSACGEHWFLMLGAMWEGWKGRSIEMDRLAAENVTLKSKGKELLGEACAVYSRLNKLIDPSIGDFVDGQTLHEFQFVLDAETPASDRIVAGIKADGVEEWVSSRGGRWNGTTEEALKFAKQLREGADK